MLTISGTVSAIEPTKGGGWARVIIQSGRRVNDLVLVRKDTAGQIKVGQAVDLPVDARVEMAGQGENQRPTRNIVFFHADRGGDAA